MEIMTTPRHVAGVSVARVVTTGDGLDNNVWLIGNDHECIIIDAAHNATSIVDAVGGRSVKAIVCTHGHNDHINAVEELRSATGAPAFLHPDDAALWDETVPRRWDRDLADGTTLDVAGVSLEARHTPGHTRGSTVLYVPALATVFTGDTLFQGGPGATRFAYSSFPQIIDSITERLLSLPGETLVLTGHGASTTIGTETPDRQAWIDRGY